MKPPKTYKRNLLSETALRLPFQEGGRWVSLDQIVRLEGVGNYTSCVFADGSVLLVALTLRRLADRIPAGAFVRAHRKHLVNRAFVVRIRHDDPVVQLVNGERLEIARRRFWQLRRELSIGPNVFTAPAPPTGTSTAWCR
jgi:two-component system, LytTR family, response regulator